MNKNVTYYQAFQTLTLAGLNNTPFEDAFNTMTLGQYIGVYNLFGMKHGLTVHLGFNSIIFEYEGEQKSFELLDLETNQIIYSNGSKVSEVDFEQHTYLLETLIRLIDLDNESIEDETQHFKYNY